MDYKIRRIVREWYLFLCDSYHLFLISTWLSAGNNLYAVFQKNKSNGLCRNAHLHISMWSGYIIYHILMSVFNIQIMGKPLALTIKYVYKDYNKYPDPCYSEISTKHHVHVHVVQMIPMAPCWQCSGQWMPSVTSADPVTSWLDLHCSHTTSTSRTGKFYLDLDISIFTRAKR